MAVGNVKGFKVKKGSETGIAKIATEAYLDGSVTKAKLATAVQDTLDEVPNKADANGDYDDLTAGGAKQLLSPVYVDDSVPYNFRTSGGTADIGDRMYDEVVGGTVVWNQHYSPLTNSPQTSNGITATKNEDGYSWTVSGTSTAIGSIQLGGVNKANGSLISNHIYYCTLRVKNGAYNTWYGGIAGLGIDYGNGGLYKHTYTFESTGIRVDFKENVTIDNVVLVPQWIDLTQMFGATIADYIYSLEQGTAGAGVAWFRNLFPKPYYEYNAGTLMSVKAGSHDTVGFNQFNLAQFAELYPSNCTMNGDELQVTGTGLLYSEGVPVTFLNDVAGGYITAEIKLGTASNIRVRCVYEDGSATETPHNSITSNTYTKVGARLKTTTRLKYVRFNWSSTGTFYVRNLCLNYEWDGERNGEYEPYEKHEYPLAELELRGIPKLDANNGLYYDGDTYASDGTVTRKYGVITFNGSEGGWNKSTAASNAFWIGGFGKKSYGAVVNNKGYPLTTSAKTYYTTYGVCYSDQSLAFSLDPAVVGSTVESFKAWLANNPITVVYELAEPTTETADTFVNPQVVDDFGTEEYVDYAYEAGDRDVAIPVGHNSQYMNNLRAKLEMSPESPSGDGKYIVQQSNGENAYIPYTADGRLDAIEAKLPAPPSTNGTYKLTATVTDGSVVYAWVAG